MAEIITIYGKEIGALEESQSDELYSTWKGIILETVVSSFRQTKEMIPVAQYLAAIDANICNHSIAIAANRGEYAGGISHYYGFTEDGYLYLKPDWTYKMVVDYRRGLNKYFSASQGKIRKELYESKLLRTQGTSYLYKISIEKDRQVNMLAVNAEQMRQIVAPL